MMLQTRAQRLDQLSQQRDRLRTKALAYEDLARHIAETSASVHAYDRHWRRIARVLRTDVIRLMSEATEIQDRIDDLERARHAAETWTPPPPQPERKWTPLPAPEQEQESTMSHIFTVAELFNDEDMS